ncbi:MAG: HAMP domain-containing histidine kinase [Clostridia bacterium]|nr:HAMP domain-containing histidine kinase [Clostridia bacterium]
MSKKLAIDSKNILTRVFLVSSFFLAVMIILSTVLNIVLQPKLAVREHAYENKDKVEKEIAEFTLDNSIMEKFRAVERKYGVLIETYSPEGNICYSTFADEIRLSEEFKSIITDSDIKTTDPITDHERIIAEDVHDSEKDDEKSSFRKVRVKNTNTDYYLYETEIKEKGFQENHKLKIYLGTYDYAETLKKSGETKAWLNAVVLFFVWAAMMGALTWTYSKIKDINITVKDMIKLDFSRKCPTGTSELGRLGNHINELVRTSEETIKMLTAENQRLREKLEMKQQMEDEKKDFLANAAHEMKTPLAVIQAYAEGLKMGIAKGGRARQDYCNIIMEETEKMNKLVLELLSLSKYKQKMFENIKEENISIRSFVQGVINSMNPILKENSIEIDNTINKKLIGRTDIEKASTVLSNYINNAISHTNMYRKIVISCEEKTNTYRINVFNTGDHIPEEDKKNIWDSFYRADRSHQRSEGRFGIGLSIVETIMNALGNDYGVENVYGGVQFWFEVKKPKKD